MKRGAITVTESTVPSSTPGDAHNGASPTMRNATTQVGNEPPTLGFRIEQFPFFLSAFLSPIRACCCIVFVVFSLLFIFYYCYYLNCMILGIILWILLLLGFYFMYILEDTDFMQSREVFVPVTEWMNINKGAFVSFQNGTDRIILFFFLLYIYLLNI